jgi:GT2 family glycosyltransferase
MDKNKFAIVIVNFESEIVLANLLADIAIHDRAKVYVVDNSVEHKLPDRFSVEDLDVTLMRTSENVGFGSACNIGALRAFSDGMEYVFFVNPDVRIQGDVFSQMVGRYCLDGNNKKVVVPSIVFDDSPDVVWYGGGDVTPLLLRAQVRNYMETYNDKDGAAERDITFATGCFMLLSSCVFKITSGFDERIFLYEEDVDFSLRCRNSGIKLVHYPDVCVRHVCQFSSRDVGDDFVPILSPVNKKLTFYLEHILKSKKIVFANYPGKLGRWIRILLFKIYQLALLFKYRKRWDACRLIVRDVVKW